VSITLVSIVLRKTFAKIAKKQPSASTLKLVAIALTDHGSDEGYSIHPSIAKTAARTDLTRRSVSNALAFFRKIDLFSPVGVVGKKQQVIDYRCNVERLLSLPDAQIDPAPERTSERRSRVNEVHGHVGTTFTGTSEPDSQLTVILNRQSETSEEPARERARPGQSAQKEKREKKPRRVFSEEEKEKIAKLDAAIRKTTLVVGAESLTKKIAVKLMDSGYDEKDITGLYVGDRSAWRRFDFRGKKGERPTPTLIQYTIGDLADRASRGSSEGAPNPQSRQALILQRAREKTRDITERTAANGA